MIDLQNAAIVIDMDNVKRSNRLIFIKGYERVLKGKVKLFNLYEV